MTCSCISPALGYFEGKFGAFPNRICASPGKKSALIFLWISTSVQTSHNQTVIACSAFNPRPWEICIHSNVWAPSRACWSLYVSTGASRSPLASLLHFTVSASVFAPLLSSGLHTLTRTRPQIQQSCCFFPAGIIRACHFELPLRRVKVVFRMKWVTAKTPVVSSVSTAAPAKGAWKRTSPLHGIDLNPRDLVSQSTCRLLMSLISPLSCKLLWSGASVGERHAEPLL